MYNQGDVILVPFPFSDLRGVKKRPALIISNKKVNNGEDRICCLITSNPKNKGLLIHQEYFKKGKLPFASWVKPQRIFSVDENIILRKICEVNKVFHQEVFSEIVSFLK